MYIYSTLVYIQSQAKQLNIPTACMRFDQPLWYKAVDIITKKLLNIICRLGRFHTIMSFLGVDKVTLQVLESINQWIRGQKLLYLSSHKA